MPVGVGHSNTAHVSADRAQSYDLSQNHTQPSGVHKYPHVSTGDGHTAPTPLACSAAPKACVLPAAHRPAHARGGTEGSAGPDRSQHSWSFRPHTPRSDPLARRAAPLRHPPPARAVHCVSTAQSVAKA
eukprot:184476-Rhodomonas_salina.2